MANHSTPAGPSTPAAASGAAQKLELSNLTQIFQPSPRKPPLVALEDVSLEVEGGQFISIVGPTGCGKSTMLSAISGLRPPSKGEVRIGGQKVAGVRQDVGFVFQQDALLPWRTALQNVELALRFRGVNRKESRERARGWLARVGLGAFENAYPHQLSGGMRKRTAIASTLVYDPSILLMDEPFSALDVQTRNLMENDLLGLWEESGHQTVFFVTHDLEEAIGLSDRIIVLTASPGRILGDYRVDLPRPRNLLEVKLDEGFIDLYRSIWADLEGEVMKASRIASKAEL
ncbi:MAG TPA: ABC transporter ATP-binding protein [Acidimicrobiales bacterium]|nr:ABC transporter ATP-binding protein [Acidimicrobiales bacterium]